MMMEINLLPHREARRAADLRETVAVLLFGLVVIGGAIFFTDKSVKADLHMAQANVAQLKADISRYEPQQKLVGEFKTRKKQLQDKLDIIESLENARNGPVRILDELSSNVPERLWLTGIQTKGVGIRLEGQSLDTGVVADFLRGLNASPFFTNVDLDKTAGGKIVAGVRLVNFVIRADMQSPVVATTEVAAS
jgi:type IV pilus assembly protein PilN